ncbi:MAG: hypothetical protein LQ344_006641 [Seirophora lacunosa]|nr:MAG: hypothetical protein LQ344_006641 [Seirophora lacunosa]
MPQIQAENKRSNAGGHDGKPKPKDGIRLTSPIFILTAGPDHEQYAVHKDILEASPVLGRMCDGQFHEAHHRQITLPDDDPTAVGILVEYLYTRDFWAQEDPEAGASKHDSATKLAQVYILADTYDLERMKDLVTRKMRKYTELEKPAEWLSVAEIIYAATPESDRRYPRFLRALVAVFMRAEQIHGRNGFSSTLMNAVEKGGRLAIDVCLGSRMYWRDRVRGRNAELLEAQESLQSERRNHDSNHEYCEEDCFDTSRRRRLTLFNNENLAGEDVDEDVMNDGEWMKENT